MFLERQAQRLGLPLKVFYMTPEKPVVILTWLGQRSELPSLLLTSHMDVVPVYPVSKKIVLPIFNIMLMSE